MFGCKFDIPLYSHTTCCSIDFISYFLSDIKNVKYTYALKNVNTKNKNLLDSFSGIDFTIFSIK